MSHPGTQRFRWLRLLVRVFEFCAARLRLPLRHRWLAPLAVFPGRDGLPRSLGSVLGAAVARFLPHGFWHTPHDLQVTLPPCNARQLCVTDDGSTVLTLENSRCRPLKLSAWPPLGVVAYRWSGSMWAPRLRVEHPFARYLCVAPDDTVFVAKRYEYWEVHDYRLPALSLGAFYYTAATWYDEPSGIAANDEHVFVSRTTCIEAVCRRRGDVMHTIASVARVAHIPNRSHMFNFCVMRQGTAQRLAVADGYAHRLTVYALDGTPLRFWDIDAVPTKCVYRAVSDELIMYAGDIVECMYVFSGIMGDSGVFVRRVFRGVTSKPLFVFCGETTLNAS